jgi:hypothetical protein
LTREREEEKVEMRGRREGCAERGVLWEERRREGERTERIGETVSRLFKEIRRNEVKGRRKREERTEGNRGLSPRSLGERPRGRRCDGRVKGDVGSKPEFADGSVSRRKEEEKTTCDFCSLMQCR